jgi:hypothetical protein
VLDQLWQWFDAIGPFSKLVAAIPTSLLVKEAAKAVWQRIRPATAKEWVELADRFGTTSPNVYSIWNRFEGAPRADWWLYHQEGATVRDRDLLQAEAKRAAQLYLRSLPQRLRVGLWIGRDVEDVWLEVITALVHPRSDVKLSGRSFGVNTEGAVLENVAEMSKVACMKLAAGEKPALKASLLAVARYERQRRRLIRADKEFLAQVMGRTS